MGFVGTATLSLVQRAPCRLRGLSPHEPRSRKMVFRAFLAPRIGGDCCCWSGRSQFRFKERGQSKLLPFHFGNWVAALVPAIVCSTLAEPRKYASFWMVHREVAEDRRVLCRLECDPGLTAIGQK